MSTTRDVILNLSLKTGGTSALKNALVDITREIQRQEQELVRRKALLNDPVLLHKRAALELETEQASKKLKELLADEKKKIAIDVEPAKAGSGKSLFDHIGGWMKQLNLPGGDLLGKLGETFAKSGGASEGGIGGLLKGLMGSGGAAAGGEAAGAGAAGLAGGGAAAGGEAAGAGAAGLAGGGAAMAALTGPIGIAVAAVAVLGPVIKKLGAAPFDKVASGLNTVTKGLQGLNSSGSVGVVMGGFTDSMDGLADEFTYVQPLLGGMAKGVVDVSRSVTAFMGVAAQLVAKASPGAIKRLQLAQDDSAAVAGHRLTPLVETETKAERAFGGLLNTMLPNTEKFRNLLSPINDFFSNTPPWMKSTVGAAARPTSFVDAKSYSHGIDQAFYSSGVDPTKQTAENTVKIATLMQSIYDLMKKTGPKGPGAQPPAAQGTPAWANRWLGI